MSRAKEVVYTGVKGTMKTDFKVTGDDYRQDGRVVAWRALLIENGKIVGLTASNLWDIMHMRCLLIQPCFKKHII